MLLDNLEKLSKHTAVPIKPAAPKPAVKQAQSKPKAKPVKPKPKAKSVDLGAPYGGDVVGRRVGAIIEEKKEAKAAGPAKDYCFIWGGQKWGKKHPGRAAFEQYLRAHNSDIDKWIDAHLPAAACIGMVYGKRAKPPAKPVDTVSGQTLVAIPRNLCQGGAERLIQQRFLSEVEHICGVFGCLVSSAYRTAKQNEDAGGATNSDHLRGTAVDLVGGRQTALYNWAIAQKYPYVEPMAEAKTHVHISFEHGGSKPSNPTDTGSTGLSGVAFVNQMRASADLYDVDPIAAAANGLHEGFHGGIGDNGESYGPFQAKFGDGRVAKWSGEPWGSARLQAWAWSAEGIQEAFREMAADGANHSTGLQAVHDIVYLFERPNDKPGAYKTRATEYNNLIGKGANVWKYVADQVGGDTSGPYVPPSLPDIDASDTPHARAAWADLRSFLARDIPQTGIHATAVGRRLGKVTAKKPWTITTS